MWHTKIFNIKDKAYVEQNNSLSIEELSRWYKKKNVMTYSKNNNIIFIYLFK